MRILAIQPSIYDGEGTFPESPRVFPWGFASVLTIVEQLGHAVELLDAYGDGLTRSDVRKRLDSSSCDCVFISAFASMNYAYVEWLSQEIRTRSNAPIVLGGLLAELHYELLLKTGVVDVCAFGEGEDTAVEILSHFGSWADVKGIAFARDGRVIRTEHRSAPLVARPRFPHFEIFHLTPYLQGPMSLHSSISRFEEYGVGRLVAAANLVPNFAIFAGKGCPFRCNFCSRSANSVYLKPVEQIVSEVRYLKEHFGIRAVQFKDELLVINRSRTQKLCEALAGEGILWECQSRVDTLDRESLELMAKSGCISVGLGVESGSDRMLRAMNKGITRSQIMDVLRGARHAGIHVRLQLMCGYPGETNASLEETASLFSEVGIPPRPMSWCTPMPGSSLYDNAKASGLIPDELSYLRALSHGINKPEHIILNVSGVNDDIMAVLSEKAHLSCEWNYIRWLLKEPKRAFILSIWRKMLRYGLAKMEYLRILRDRDIQSSQVALSLFEKLALPLVKALSRRRITEHERKAHKPVRHILFKA